MREANIERYLVQCAAQIGGELRKVRWIGRHAAPDRVLMLDGATIWIELKAPGETPKRHQAREHKRMRDMGQRVEVIDSPAQVDALFDEFTPAMPA